MVDLAYLVTGPMKLEMMTPHVEKHGVFRFRQQSEQQFFYLERHKKSVLNAEGKKLVCI